MDKVNYNCVLNNVKIITDSRKDQVSETIDRIHASLYRLQRVMSDLEIIKFPELEETCLHIYMENNIDLEIREDSYKLDGAIFYYRNMNSINFSNKENDIDTYTKILRIIDKFIEIKNML